MCAETNLGLSDEGVGSNQIKRGDTKNSIGIVDAMLLENLARNWNG